MDRMIVAVDDGYAEVKVAAEVDGKLRSGSVPSRAARGAVVTSASGAQVATYRSEGEVYCAWPAAQTEPTRIEEYPTSTLNRVLVQHALCDWQTLRGLSVSVATGLPVGAFYRGGVVNRELVARKRESLMKPVEVLGGQGVQVAEVFVYPQALSAWVDYMLDDEGERNEARWGQAVGVVDVGGRTTDFAVVLPGPGGAPAIDHRRSGSVDLGVLDVVDALRPVLMGKLGAREIPESVVVEAVATNRVRAFGDFTDVSEEVRAAAADVVARVSSETQQRFGSGADLDVVLFVGGGAVVMSEALAYLRHARVPKNPAHANARGMWKYARFVDEDARDARPTRRAVAGGR